MINYMNIIDDMTDFDALLQEGGIYISPETLSLGYMAQDDNTKEWEVYTNNGSKYKGNLTKEEAERKIMALQIWGQCQKQKNQSCKSPLPLDEIQSRPAPFAPKHADVPPEEVNTTSITDGKGVILQEIILFRDGEWNFTQDLGMVFKVDAKFRENIVKNWNNRVRGQDIPVVDGHDGSKRAYGWLSEMWNIEDRTMIKVNWNKRGVCALENKEFAYHSPQVKFNYVDAETGIEHGETMIELTLTNVPRIKKTSNVLVGFAEDRDNNYVCLAELGYSDRENLPNSCFALVKDDVRKLPYKNKDGSVNKAHVKNALARINQVDGFSPEEKKKALRKLIRAAKSVGIEVSDDTPKMKLSDETIKEIEKFFNIKSQINLNFDKEGDVDAEEGRSHSKKEEVSLMAKSKKGLSEKKKKDQDDEDVEEKEEQDEDPEEEDTETDKEEQDEEDAEGDDPGDSKSKKGKKKGNAKMCGDAKMCSGKMKMSETTVNINLEELINLVRKEDNKMKVNPDGTINATEEEIGRLIEEENAKLAESSIRAKMNVPITQAIPVTSATTPVAVQPIAQNPSLNIAYLQELNAKDERIRLLEQEKQQFLQKLSASNNSTMDMQDEMFLEEMVNDRRIRPVDKAAELEVIKRARFDDKMFGTSGVQLTEGQTYVTREEQVKRNIRNRMQIVSFAEIGSAGQLPAPVNTNDEVRLTEEVWGGKVKRIQVWNLEEEVNKKGIEMFKSGAKNLSGKTLTLQECMTEVSNELGYAQKLAERGLHYSGQLAPSNNNMMGSR